MWGINRFVYFLWVATFALSLTWSLVITSPGVVILAIVSAIIIVVTAPKPWNADRYVLISRKAVNTLVKKSLHTAVDEKDAEVCHKSQRELELAIME